MSCSPVGVRESSRLAIGPTTDQWAALPSVLESPGQRHCSACTLATELADSPLQLATHVFAETGVVPRSPRLLARRSSLTRSGSPAGEFLNNGRQRRHPREAVGLIGMLCRAMADAGRVSYEEHRAGESRSREDPRVMARQ